MKTRTLVSLEVTQLRALKAKARRENLSVAELMRRIVRASLETPPEVPRVPVTAYRAIVGLGSSGKNDVSDRHDAYLGDALRRDHDR